MVECKTYGEIAALIHAHMCTNPNVGVYRSDPLARWGDKEQVELNINNKSYSYSEGPYDGTSSIISAWKLALQYTKYNHSLDEATYSGNMRETFFKSGLFDILQPDTLNVSIGDIYLNEMENAVIWQGNGKVSSFLYREFEDILLKGEIVDWYDHQWDCVLHYNGKLDLFDKLLAPLPDMSLEKAYGGNYQ